MKRILLFFMAMGMMACNQLDKANYIMKYENFITEVSKNYKNYDEAAKAKADATFKQYSDTDYKKYESSMTPEEKSKVNQLTGKYYVIISKDKFNDVTKEFEKLLDHTKGALEEINK